MEANRKKYHSSSITREPYLKPLKLLSKYLKEFGQKKWDWFKKDVYHYLNQLFNKSEDEYRILEDRVNRSIFEKKGLQEEADKCLEGAKKKAKAVRKIIQKAKKEHSITLKKLFDNQGNSAKILGYIKDFLIKYNIPQDLKVSVSYSAPCLDGYDENATKKLKIKISGSKTYHIKPTETIRLIATVSGGKAPVDIHWEGGNISPSGSTAIFAATTPGSYSVQITAKDANGESTSDSVSITVAKITMPTLSALSNEVYYGTSTIVTVEGIKKNIPKVDNDPCKGRDRSTITNPFDPCLKIDPGSLISVNVDPDPSHPGIIMAPADDTEDIGPIPTATATKEDNSKKIEEGEYEYTWQPSGGGLEFDPVSGKDPTVKVTFGKIGNIKIWAEIKKNGEYIGDTEPIETKVIPPQFTLDTNPKTLYIGDEGKAIITLDPNIDDKFTDFRWLPMGNNAQKLIESGNGRSTTFKLKSIKPVTIEVLIHAKSPYYGGELDSVKYVVSAKPYEVKVSKPKRLDKAPWIWDIKQGTTIELPEAIAVFQNSEVHATITPKPKERVSYKWTADPEGCTILSPMSKSTNLNAHEAKIYTITVKVSDKNGIELGKSSISHAVTVSQRDLDVAKQKAEAAKKAKKLLKGARMLWQEGKLQQAIAKVLQAQKLAGKDKEIAKQYAKWHQEKKRIDSLLTKAKSVIQQKRLKEAQKILKEAAVISDKYPPYKKVLEKLKEAQVKAEKEKEEKRLLDASIQEAKRLWEQGELGKAIVGLSKVAQKLPKSKLLLDILHKMQRQKSQEDSLIVQAEQKIRQGRLQSAESLLARAASTNSKYPKYLNALKFLKETVEKKRKKEEAEKKAQKLLEKSLALWKAGKLDQAVVLIPEIEKELKGNRKAIQKTKKMKQQKKIIDMHIKRASDAIENKKLAKAEKSLDAASQISKVYQKYTELLKKLKDARKKEREEAKKRDQKLMRKAKKLWDSGKLKKAIRTLQNASPGTKQARFLKKLHAAKDAEDGYIMQAEQAIRQGKLPWADTLLGQAGKINQRYPRYIETQEMLRKERNRISQLREQKKFEEEKIAREIEAELENIEREEYEKQAAMKKQNEEERIAREIEAELKAIETSESIRQASELASKTVQARKQPRTIPRVKKRPSLDRRQNIIVGKWKNSKGVIIRFDKKSTGEFVGSMVYFDKKLLSYGFRVGEVGYRLKYINNGKYRGKSKVHHRDRSTSWKNISYEVRGDRILKTSWRRTSDSGISNRNEKREKFMGTMTGSWKGPWVRGSFRMQISENGRISGTYWGDDKGKLSGYVSTSGALNVKSGGGAAGSGKWGGTMTTDSSGRLHGKGTWSAEGYSGTWRGR